METKEDQCKFIEAWVGRCTKPAGDSGYCEYHLEKKCKVCGNQATHNCDHTGQFVCGAWLCDNCEGATRSKDDPKFTSRPGLGWGFMNHYHRPKQES